MKFVSFTQRPRLVLAACFSLLAVAPAPVRAASGELDASFSPVPGSTGQVASLGDGKVLGLGDYTGGIDGVEISLVRYNGNGSVDSAFADPYSEFAQAARHFRVESDGRIVVAGGIFAGQASNQTLTLLKTNGAFDPGFNLSSAAVSGLDIRIQKDGKILSNAQSRVGSNFGTVLTRLNLDGSVDQSFDTPNSLISSVPTDFLIQPDGKVVMVGIFSDYDGSKFSTFSTVRFNTDGTYDTGFQRAPAEDYTQGLTVSAAVQADGKLLVSSGKRDASFSYTVSTLRRYNANGTLDGSFSPTFSAGDNAVLNTTVLRCLLVQRDGKIVVAGKFGAVNGVKRVNIARLNADGSLDGTFVSPGEFAPVLQAQVLDLAEQADGKLLVGGTLYSAKPDPASSATVVYGLVRLLNDDSGNVTPPTGKKLPDLSASLAKVKLKLNQQGKPVLKGTLTVTNGGKKTANGITAAAYLSADDRFDVTRDTFLQVVDLAAYGFDTLQKGTATVPIVLKLKPSSETDARGKYLLVVVDPTGDVTESNEANNVAAAGPL